jgi:hypothetical protein
MRYIFVSFDEMYHIRALTPPLFIICKAQIRTHKTVLRFRAHILNLSTIFSCASRLSTEGELTSLLAFAAAYLEINFSNRVESHDISRVRSLNIDSLKISA